VMKRALVAALVLVFAALPTLAQQSTHAQEPAPNGTTAEPSPLEMLNSYLDRRWLPEQEAREATDVLLAQLAEAGCGPDEVESLLRGGRDGLKTPPTLGKLALVKGLACEHVDYETSFFLYLPTSTDPARPAPVLLVGHGGTHGFGD
jgi:hypothetical protein